MEYKTEDELLEESFIQDYKDMDGIMKSLLMALGILVVMIGLLVYAVISIIRVL